jgi:cysteinyl-tRNA synthetase
MKDYKNVKWNPDFYLHNVDKGYALSEKQHKVPFSSRLFADYGSLHMTKIIELNALLKGAKVKKSKAHKGINSLYLLRKNTDWIIKEWRKRKQGIK